MVRQFGIHPGHGLQTLQGAFNPLRSDAPHDHRNAPLVDNLRHRHGGSARSIHLLGRGRRTREGTPAKEQGENALHEGAEVTCEQGERGRELHDSFVLPGIYLRRRDMLFVLAPDLQHRQKERAANGLLLLPQAVHTHIIAPLGGPLAREAQTGALRRDERAPTGPQIHLAHLVCQLQNTRESRHLPQHIQNAVEELGL